jgi:LPXTG-motif cell wall-anchored protein
VPTADVGSPTQSSLLEEVGSYSFGSAHPQSGVTNTMAEVDQLPLEVDGVCCFNFQGQSAAIVPEAPWTPALLGIGAALVAAGLFRRRRRRALLLT